MSRITQAAKKVLSDIRHFSNIVVQLPLRPYQARPLKAVLDSILGQHGREYLLIFPRQSGKNEAVAQLLVYLLNIMQRRGGNIIYGATGDALGMGRERLADRLDNPWNAGKWTRRTKPLRTCLNSASVTFLSTHPSASARGQTAHWLLVIDEAQDVLGSHIEAVFTPMRAANNATALYIGTVKLTTDFLWLKKLELEAETARDGIRRVFLVPPEAVARDNPPYAAFLDAQVSKHGRHHPIVASEYYLEPIDGSGGLFDKRRRRMMHGLHERETNPRSGRLYVATLDVAGQDEAATDPIAQLARPGRDYTVATIFEVDFPDPNTHGASGARHYAPGPTYRALDIFVDHGSKHFDDVPGRPALIHRLAAWLDSWNVAHLVADESGVGQGLVAWLQAAMGQHRVTGFNFAGRGKKAALGSAFLALIETGRFRYWATDADIPLSDAWWFWKQAAACSYELPPDGQFDRDLRWEVHASHRTDTPTGRQPTHDDRLISAALIAELDRIYRAGDLSLGLAKSAITHAPDPLDGDIY